VTHVENTLPAVLAGFELGADMAEIDLKLTADDEVVAIHDDRLRRVWNTRGTVRGSTWPELRGLRRHGAQIPELSEVLSATSRPLMLDLGGSRVASAALEVVRRLGAMARCLFVSGDVTTLSGLRASDPGARLGLTWERRGLPDPGLLRELSPEYWNPALRVAGRRRVQALHDLGYCVSVWTVDRRYRMRQALSLGVEAVVTNQIARLVALREQR
jgi:glycerophosphoryl diester phosphodiesterase